MTEKKQQEGPEQEPIEPGGRRHQLTENMTSEDIAAAYADATRLRAHELGWNIDSALGTWMRDARKVLTGRGHLDLIRDHLAVYFDPSRKTPVFGPGGKLAGQGKPVEDKAVRAITVASR